MSRPSILATLTGILLLAAGCGGNHTTAAPSATTVAGSSARVADLRSIDELRQAFNAAGGEPRLIVLASPT